MHSIYIHCLRSIIMCLRRVLAKLQASSRAERQASEPVGTPEIKKKPKKAKGEIEEKLFPEKDSCPNHKSQFLSCNMQSRAEILLSIPAHASGYGQSSGFDERRARKAVPAECAASKLHIKRCRLLCVCCIYVCTWDGGGEGGQTLLTQLRWAKEDATGPEGDEEEQGSKNTKNSKKNKQKKKEIKKSNKESEKGNRDSNSGDAEEPHAITRMKRTMAPDCAYVPGSYKEARLRYIKRKREKGWSWKEACQKWNASAIRGSWLEGLSTNELKRRRFI